jgi:N-acetylglutamate synthase
VSKRGPGRADLGARAMSCGEASIRPPRFASPASGARTLVGGTFEAMEANGQHGGDEHAPVAAPPAKRVVRLLDELASRATAPAIVEPLEGWLLRASPDAPFRRANSVLPNGGLPDGRSVQAAIRTVEAFYASHDRPARFQLSSAARPSNLDAILDQRGYVIETPVVVMCAGATIVLARTQGEGRVTNERGKRAWERANASMHGDSHGARERVLAYGRALNALKVPATGVVAPPEPGAGVAIGFAVAERGWTGIFGMGTRPEARRQGAATAVLHTLARWAAEHDAPRLYLQVEEENTAARTLYTRAGFVDTYHYHYRTRVP